jgi:chromosome partitioning protein
MRIVSIVNCKGGVGKTTLTACTAQALALTGFKVLVIDNDMQHNVSLMLTHSEEPPTIRDVYRAPNIAVAAQTLRHAIRPGILDNLHVIISGVDLSHTDVHDTLILKKALHFSRLDRFYHYVLIDNPPGVDNLQSASIRASDAIFVPTELSLFAMSGVRDLRAILARKFPETCGITKIVPNFYLNKPRYQSYLRQLNEMFPGKVTSTAIPYDPVFDTLASERKVLYLSMTNARVTSYYIKLMHELFELDEVSTWQQVMRERSTRVGAHSL